MSQLLYISKFLCSFLFLLISNGNVHFGDFHVKTILAEAKKKLCVSVNPTDPKAYFFPAEPNGVKIK